MTNYEFIKALNLQGMVGLLISVQGGYRPEEQFDSYWDECENWMRQEKKSIGLENFPVYPGQRPPEKSAAE